MPTITLARIKELFILDRTKWQLVWKVSPSQSVPAGQVAGCLSNDGYRVIQLDRRSYKAHRIIWAYVHGKFPPAPLDHKNHIKDDNNPSNLRLASGAINSKNLPLSSNNTSGVTGVSWNKAAGKWKAQIHVNGKRIYLGYFTNKKEAIKARKKAEKKYGFHPNHGRK